MVRNLLLVVLFSCASFVQGQNLSMGLGGNGNFSRVGLTSGFNFGMLTNDLDTLVLQANSATVEKSISLPIFMRYSSKKSWWVQANYGFETWRFEVQGTATPTSYAISQAVDQRLASSWSSYTGELDSVSFRNAVYELYQEDEERRNASSLVGYERVQYNRLSVLAGSLLNRKGAIKFYFGLGMDLLMTSTFESYQGLELNSNAVTYKNEVLDALPKLTALQAAPIFNFGLQRQNLRIGLDFALYPLAVKSGNLEAKNQTVYANGISGQLVNDIKTFGVHLNYTFFNHNFNQRISPDKKAVLDPEVIGRYRQKPRLFQIGASIDFPTLLNTGWSVLEGFDLIEDNEALNTALQAENDSYLTGAEVDRKNLYDFIYIEQEDETVYINESGDLDTNSISTLLFFDSGNINTILKSPKFSGFIRLNPHELFSLDLRLGYQHQTYGIIAYEKENTVLEDGVVTQLRRLLYQENFHEVSLGGNAYFQRRINNVSQIGAHIGLNFNAWIPGQFTVEKGGVNDSPLLEDFHNYMIYNEGENEWNRTLNAEADKGIFSKEDYYNHTYNPASEIAENESYHRDFSDYQLNSTLNRSFFEVRMGVDYYVENLKFTVYGEHSVWKKTFLYNNLFSLGMSVSMFIY